MSFSPFAFPLTTQWGTQGSLHPYDGAAGDEGRGCSLGLRGRGDGGLWTPSSIWFDSRLCGGTTGGGHSSVSGQDSQPITIPPAQPVTIPLCLMWEFPPSLSKFKIGLIITLGS